VWARLLCAVAVFTWTTLPGPVLAAGDVISGIRVDSLSEGYSRVVITFTRTAPMNWQFSGEGSNILIVRFPDASPSGPASDMTFDERSLVGLRDLPLSCNAS
jgi:hypothetical protein